MRRRRNARVAIRIGVGSAVRLILQRRYIDEGTMDAAAFIMPDGFKPMFKGQ